MAAKRVQLVRARQAAGYTQESLAHALDVDTSTVRRWEAGETAPQPSQRPKLTHTLQLSDYELGQLLAGGDDAAAVAVGSRTPANSPATPPGGVVLPEGVAALLHPSGMSAPLLRELTRLLTASTGIQPPAGLAELLLSYLTAMANTPPTELSAWPSETPRREEDEPFTDVPLRLWADLMKRRGLLQLFGLTATTAATSPLLGSLQVLAGLDPDAQERMAKAVAAPKRVDAQVIGYIETMLWACKRQEDTFGPQAVLNTVITQLNLVRGLVSECPDTLRPRLLSLKSSLHSSAGWYFFDLNNFDFAWYHCEQARLAAHKARNPELSVFTLCQMSYVASWHGKTHVGIDHAMAAQSLAMKTGDLLLRVCVTDKAAMSYAVDGQYDDCMAEVEKAQTLLSASAGQTSPESPAYYYNEGFLSNLKSEYMLRLGRPQEAIVSATAALTQYNKSFARDLAFCTLHLAKAHIQTKDIDQAATVRLIHGKRANTCPKC